MLLDLFVRLVRDIFYNMLSINYNPSALKAQNNLAFASDAVSSALERMKHWV